MDKEQAAAEIAIRCVKLRELFDECVTIAKEGGVSFDLPWGGEGTSVENGYGAGATFYPDDVENYAKNWGTHAQWVSSTQTC